MYYNIDSIKIDIRKSINNNYRLALLFNGNSMSVFYSTDYNLNIKKIISNTIGSDNWLWEASDFFRFNNNGSLNSIILSIPNENISIRNLYMPHFISYTLNLVEIPQCCIIKKMQTRFFDLASRKLICIRNDRDFIDNKKVIMLNNNFGLIFNNKSYVGYILIDPLRFLTNSYSYSDLIKEEPTSIEYSIFNLYLKIVSDNNLKRHNNSIEDMMKDIKEIIIPKLSTINTKRIEIIKKELNELIDFWL